MRLRKLSVHLAGAFVTSGAFLVAACGDDAGTFVVGEDASPPADSGPIPGEDASDVDAGPKAPVSIGGQVTGLEALDGGAPDGGAAQKLILQNNGGDDLTVSANGPFTFATSVASGAGYAVAVKSQPTGFTCTVAKGSGTATAAVTDIAVTCATADLTVKANVKGLTKAGLVLQNNGASDLTVNAAGVASFTTKVKFGGAYAVTTKTQPTARPKQTCVVDPAKATGTAFADVTVDVDCTDSFGTAASYTSDATFAADTFTVGMLFDGTNYVSVDCCSASDSIRFFDGAFAAGNTFPIAPVIGPRGFFFAKGAMYARNVSTADIYAISATGVSSLFRTLASAPSNPDANIVFDAVGDRFISQTDGTLQSWKFADGTALPDVTLENYANDPAATEFVNNFWVAAARGYALTIAGGTLNVWDLTTGKLKASTVLTGIDARGGNQVGASLSYANDRVWLRDVNLAPGNWLGFDIGL